VSGHASKETKGLPSKIFLFASPLLFVAYHLGPFGRVAQCLFVCVTMPFAFGDIAEFKLLPEMQHCDSLDWGIHR
jgi:hypothetical protein